MSDYPDYISEKRRPVTPPECIVTRGKAVFGTFNEPFKTLNLRDCEQPCGFLIPHFMNKTRLTEWEAFEINMDECSMVSAIYNTGLLGFSIIVVHDKRKNKIYEWKSFVPAARVKVAPQLIDGVSTLKTKRSIITITNDFGNGKAHGAGSATNKEGDKIDFDMNVSRISPISNVSIPFGKNKPLYSEKDFLKAEGFITVNGERFETNGNSVSIIDDHKGYYPYRAHYDWLTTMGKCKIDGENKFFGFNLTHNQSTNQDDYNENLIWCEDKSYPLPPVKFTHDSKNSNIWYAKDEHGCVDIRFEIASTFKMPMHFVVVRVDYDLPFGKIYGFVKDTNGKKYIVDGMTGIGEDKTTRM